MLTFERNRYLKETEIKQLIDIEDLQLVIADISQPLIWTEKQANFDSWKNELKEHLCEDPEGCHLGDFKGPYFYYASLWTSETEKVIVFEKYH